MPVCRTYPVYIGIPGLQLNPCIRTTATPYCHSIPSLHTRHSYMALCTANLCYHSVILLCTIAPKLPPMLYPGLHLNTHCNHQVSRYMLEFCYAEAWARFEIHATKHSNAKHHTVHHKAYCMCVSLVVLVSAMDLKAHVLVAVSKQQPKTPSLGKSLYNGEVALLAGPNSWRVKKQCHRLGTFLRV